MIGAALRRVEDPRLLCGQGQYIADLAVEGMLHVSFVRSPYGHARVRSVDVSRARDMPGVAEVFSSADLPVLGKSLPVLPQTDLNLRAPSPLATGTVRFVGEAVALVVAKTTAQAVDAAEAVRVDWVPLPAVVDPFAALAETAPLVHADVPENRVGTLRVRSGDADAAISSASLVVRRTLSVGRSACAAMEPRGCIAQSLSDGQPGLLLETSTQAPHNHRTALARIFDLPPERVRVRVPDVGGGFGPKGRLYPEEVAVSAAALHLGRPIAWQADRSEDFATTHQGRGTVIKAELAADDTGRLVALRARITQDCGAYLASGLMVPANSAQHMMGPYRLPAVSIDIEGAYTNKTPISPLRGGGREVGIYVIERMMDHLATELALDPLGLRERNALGRDEFPYDTGYPSRSGATVVYDSGDFPDHLRRARSLIGYDQFREQRAYFDQGRPSVRRGIAVTLFIESTGFAGETARAWLEPDGTIGLAVGSPSNGQGHATVMPQIFAHRLGVPVESVRYQSGDTGVVGEGVGTFGSRIAVTAGNASARAALALRERIFDEAEDMLEASAGDLVLVEGRIHVRGYPARSLTLADIAERGLTGSGGIEASASWETERGGAFAGGAHAAIVEVDIETGLVRVERYVVVHDCGTVINPAIVDGQIHGGVVHGIGNALGELMVYEEGTGQLLTGSFGAYEIPGVDRAPSIGIVHAGVPSPNNPEGIKGAGEGGTIGALATIASAVENALSEFGIEVNELPVRPEWIAQAVLEARTKASGQSRG